MTYENECNPLSGTGTGEIISYVSWACNRYSQMWNGKFYCIVTYVYNLVCKYVCMYVCK